ncbi:MAG: hypothetical protein D3908_03280, partial [Candidatus Electrothrix sp. AUS4]|nr:hypothetical protein [Candidatus Electrothrix sp. AUS4]
MADIERKFTELQRAGFAPSFCIPVIPAPVGDGQGSFFPFLNTSGDATTIYSHPATGTYEVHGAILQAYVASGGPLGNLGYPTSDEHDSTEREPVGRSSDFQHGLIFWDSSTGKTYTILNGQSNFSNHRIIDGIDVSHHQGRINWNNT